MNWDFELPNGLQDADLESAELNRQASREARLKRKGICTHGWLSAPAGKPCKCNDCGKTWESVELAYEERREILI